MSAPTGPPPLQFLHGQAVVDRVLTDTGFVSILLEHGGDGELTPADRLRIVQAVADELGVPVSPTAATAGP